MPTDLTLGQIIVFEVKITVSGDTSPEDGVITFKAGWSTETTAKDAFGYDETYLVYGAFVDPSDTAYLDPGMDATVSSVSSVWVDSGGPPALDEIQGVFQVSGLDDGDSVVVEIWLVLDDTLPDKASGNVQSRLISAETSNIPGAGNAINTGNQTVPLLRVQGFETGQILGYKWEDLNGDGSWDTGEPGLDGWTIYLDLDNDNQFDASEPSFVTTADGTNHGAFWFLDLAPGTYTVREVLKPGWTQSYPVAPDEHTVTVVAGQAVEGAFGTAEMPNFGNWTTATKSGVKFEDLDADGAAVRRASRACRAGRSTWTTTTTACGTRASRSR